VKKKKRISSTALIAWFLFVVLFLSAWNADRFVDMMASELPGITPENAKVRTDRWDSYYTRYFRFMEPLAELTGASFLVMGKKSADNYNYFKDGAGCMQLLEDDFDRPRAEKQIQTLAGAFEGRGVPFIFVAMPPRFDKEDFPVARELDFFGQHDEKMIAALSGGGIDVLDAGQLMKDSGARYLYPFKTDIHLETEGEFETARLLAEKLSSMGLEIMGRDSVFDKGSYEIVPYAFTGNLVKSYGVSYTFGGDIFELWYPLFDTDLTVTNPGLPILGPDIAAADLSLPIADPDGAAADPGLPIADPDIAVTDPDLATTNPDDVVSKQGPFAESVMNGMELRGSANPYWVINYLQYPSPYYTIVNNNNKDGCKLLFIIDSYAMRTVAYLSLGAGRIDVIDTRSDGSAEYLRQAMETGGYDAVLVAAGGKDFYNSIDIGQ